MTPDDPFERSEIITALTSVEEDVHEFFSGLTAEELALREGEFWTAAEHLKHLNTAVSAVARGFSISPWLLRLRFGRPGHPSRRYDEVRSAYQALLAGGAGATAEFVPERTDGPSPAERDANLQRWRRVNARLRTGLTRWSERKLDRVALPHPLLGKLTAREMLLFTLYHNQHHIAAARRRLPPRS